MNAPAERSKAEELLGDVCLEVNRAHALVWAADQLLSQCNDLTIDRQEIEARVWRIIETARERLELLIDHLNKRER